MINHKLTGLILSAFTICTTVSAQTQAPINEPDYNKPAQFNSLPEKVIVNESELGQLLNNKTENGKQVNLRVSDSKINAFKGKIVSSSVKFQNTLHSVVIRLDDYDGATLTLSSSTKPDGTVSYTGRIISFQHRDLYELQKIDDQYIWKKRDFYELVNE